MSVTKVTDAMRSYELLGDINGKENICKVN